MMPERAEQKSSGVEQGRKTNVGNRTELLDVEDITG